MLHSFAYWRVSGWEGEQLNCLTLSAGVGPPSLETILSISEETRHYVKEQKKYIPLRPDSSFAYYCRLDQMVGFGRRQYQPHPTLWREM